MNDREPLDIKELFETVFDGQSLTSEHARAVMGSLMDGELSQMQAAALLAALRTRGETVDEIVGFAQAMRDRAVTLPRVPEGPLLDTCGTGGTGMDTINISTTAMFVIAAGGVKVAKHGNRGFTRKSGSADVLESLGMNMDATPEQLADSLEQTGLTFIFARNHHPAMKFVTPVRADLKARTIFNSLGPLTNPAGANRQLLGVYDAALNDKLARTLAGLGVRRALLVHGSGLDDVSISGTTTATELREDGSVESYEFVPEDFGLARHDLSLLRGSDAAGNAAALRAVLAGERGAHRDIVILSAAAGLYIGDGADSLADGVRLATELIDSGEAAGALERWLEFNRS